MCDGRHGCDVVAVQLRQLAAVRRKHVDESVHVGDDEFLNAVVGALLPLGLEDRNPTPCLVVVPDDMSWLHGLW